MKTQSEFKCVNIAGRYFHVKTLANGAIIRRRDDQFSVYDSKENYLGWSNTQEAAEYMGLNGYVSFLPEAAELSLWPVWNDALAYGERPLEDPESGDQFIQLPNKVVMRAGRTDSGWEVELYSLDAFWDMYGDEQHQDVLALRIAEKPYTLE